MAADDFTISTGPSTSSGGIFDWAWGFTKSAAESIPELVGINPSSETAQWRADNPVSGFFSELAGTAVPYAGWLKGLRLAEGVAGIGRIERAAQGIAATSLERPFVAAAGAEATRLLPFELGRVAASQVVGDRSLPDMALDAGINLGLASTLMGGIAKVGSFGRTTEKLKSLIPEIDESAPAQLKLRKLDELMPSVDPEIQPKLANIGTELERVVRGETPYGSDRHIDELVSGNAQSLETYFKPGLGSKNEVRRLIVSEKDPAAYLSENDWRGVVGEAGLPSDFARYAQYPRVVQFAKGRDLEEAAAAGISAEEAGLARANAAAKRAETRFSENLRPVGDGFMLGREADGGMFVLAKKFRGEIGKPAADDAWMVFKTDTPGKFVPSQKYANAQIAREKWIVGSNSLEQNLGNPGEFMRTINDIIAASPLSNYQQVSKLAPGGRLYKAAVAMTPKKLVGNELVQYASEFGREFMAPANRQFEKSSTANWVANMGRVIQETADTLGQKLIQGTAKLDEGRGFLHLAVSPELEGRSFQKIIDGMEKGGHLEDFMRIVREGMSPEVAREAVAAGRVSPEAAQLATEWMSLRDTLFKQLNDAERAAGRQPTPYHSANYFSRRWDGDVFTAVRGDDGVPVGFAAGKNNRHSQAEAAKLITKMQAETGKKYTMGETFMRDRPQGLPQDLQPYALNPGFMMERKNLRGFKWDTETPTGKDLLKEIASDVNYRTRYMANLAREAFLGRDLAAISVQDQFAHRAITTRFNQMSGIEGEFSKLQNKVTDKVLAPLIGRNSASKIVSLTNETMSHLTLGGMKLSYPVQNILGMFQTLAPQIAFSLTAPPERLAAHYVGVPLFNRAGEARGAMQVLMPFRLMTQGVQEMRRPSADLRKAMERFVNDRGIDPRVFEEFIGDNARAVRGLKDAFASPGNFLDAVKALNSFIGNWSERFARIHSFTTFHAVGRDFHGLSGDALYAFAKQGTERTQYLYSSADRPLMFTSPLGSSMGLFKNWMMNYIATMAEYTGEGIKYGNWAPLMWQTAGTFALGGMAGTPVYWAAQGFSKLWGKSAMQMAYDEFNSTSADALMLGLPAALTGVSVSSSFASPGADPVRDATQLFSFAAWERAKALGKMVGTAWDDWTVSGVHPGSDPDVRNAMAKAFAPVWFYRTMASTQETGTVVSLNQDLPQIRGLSTVDIMLYRLGFNPVALDKQLKVAEELYASKQEKERYTKVMGDAFGEAMKNGDSRGMDIAIRRSVVLGLDISSVLKSGMTHQRMELKDVTERLSKPADLEKYRNVLAH